MIEASKCVLIEEPTFSLHLHFRTFLRHGALLINALIRSSIDFLELHEPLGAENEIHFELVLPGKRRACLAFQDTMTSHSHHRIFVLHITPLDSYLGSRSTFNDSTRPSSCTETLHSNLP